VGDVAFRVVPGRVSTRELHEARIAATLRPQDRLRVVWQPHVDYVRAVGPGDPTEYGFVARAHRWWRPGWWAKAETDERTGKLRTVADAEAAARTWPQPFAAQMHLTRVDIACDIVLPHNQQFTMEHRIMFTGRGRRRTEEKKHDLRTMYIGGRESPVLLRIYDKTESNNLTERDRQHWRQNGWNGSSKVWRLEYEFHTKALPQNLELPRDTLALWSDGLARIRMCDVPPRTCCEQNKAPTNALWLSLGTAEKLTRRRCDLAVTTPEETVRRALDALDRIAVRGGVDMLERLVTRLRKMQHIAASCERKHHHAQVRDTPRPPSATPRVHPRTT